ncbi:MAG: hypothetical protein QNJ56_07205 [Gammaproteobacteria bacterium]|nr:hypothetical protein [Gammaproteobacteria bacterium]
MTHQLKEALFRAAVWSFIGVLYGMLFILTYSLSSHFAADFYPIFIAGTLSGCIAALIYSSMSLAAIVAPIASVTAIITIISQGQTIDLAGLMLVTGLVGVVTGSIYGVKAKKSRIYRADAKTIAGFLAGGSVALGFALLYEIFPGFPLYLAIAIMCLLTGSLYVAFAPFCVKHLNDLLPPVADGGIAGGGSSMFVGLLLLIMVTGVTPESAGALEPVTTQIRELILLAMFGGLLGGGISGFMSAMLRRQWQDL